MTDPAMSFEAYRPRLLGLAYRMLGSMAEAECGRLMPYEIPTSSGHLAVTSA
jgi:hypothetical protein